MFKRPLKIKKAIRIRFLLGVCIIILFGFFCKSPQQPNIIFIMCDDLGYGDLGCYGQSVIQTPNIDNLAAEGMRFTHFYSGHTVCRPSRLVLWTGLHTGHTPISSNARYVFRPEDVTIAELFREQGYVVGGVGKWSMYDAEMNGHPNDNGFDFWMGYLDQSEAHNYYPLYLWRNKSKVPLEGNVLYEKNSVNRGFVAKSRRTYSHDVMTDEAFRFIRENADHPFLLHIHWTIPHANNQAGRFLGNGMEVPDYGPYAEKSWPDAEKGFAAMVSRMDDDVGELLALLKELSIDDETMIFFTSDNGPHHEGGHDHEFFDSNGQLRGYKRDLYEGGIRAPMIVRRPGVVPAGSINDSPCAFWDYLPTACDLAEIKLSHPVDGISLLPALLGEAPPARDYLYWQFKGNNHDKIAVRADWWKAVRPAADAELELYNLQNDPSEQTNIADDFPEILERMQSYADDAVMPLK